MKLEERLERAIKEAKFNLFEVQGFMVQPDLALKAGAAIGYKLAIEETQEQITKQSGGDK